MSTRLQNGGRLIDRAKPLSFTFNGKPVQGYEGDTLASALLGQNRMMVGRSFKYHRPRGLVASGAEEPNGLVGLGEGAHGDGRADLDEAVRIARVRNDPQFLVRALAFRALLLREVAAEQAADDVREAITVAGPDARPHVATLLAVVAQAIQETAPTGWSVEGHDDHADVRLCRRFAGPARR